ncbi:hypothetical protein EDB84DRAFT_1678689 [Lactarius hengduanensis]|nr:hypothetical protein EDB84DRAFT_1678689 [Lactarius hengduanensis]
MSWRLQSHGSAKDTCQAALTVLPLEDLPAVWSTRLMIKSRGGPSPRLDDTYVRVQQVLHQGAPTRARSPPSLRYPIAAYLRTTIERVSLINRANCDLFHVPQLLITAVMLTNHAASSLCERARGIRSAAPRLPTSSKLALGTFLSPTEPAGDMVPSSRAALAPRAQLAPGDRDRKRSFFFCTPFASTTLPLAPPPPVKQHCNEDELPCMHAAGWGIGTFGAR